MGGRLEAKFERIKVQVFQNYVEKETSSILHTVLTARFWKTLARYAIWVLSWTKNLPSQIISIMSQAKPTVHLAFLFGPFSQPLHAANLTNRQFWPHITLTVRSVLEYCSVIWGGAARSHVVRVERVQHKFLMWLARYTEPNCTSLDYGHLLSFYNVQHLYARRVQSDIMFVCKGF